MVTQEIELNEALAREGIAAWETDLAELIVQLGPRPAVAHPRAGDPPQPDRDPGDLPARDGARRPARAGRPDRRPGRARRGRPAPPPREVPAGQGRDLRGELRGRRDRHGHGRRVRGQRPDVPDAARHAHHGHGHREARPPLAGPRGLPPAAAALVDRRADEPVHLDVDRRHARATGRRRSTWSCSTPGGPTRSRTRSGGRRCAASAARRASTSARSTSGPADAPTGRAYPGPIGAIITPQLRGIARHPVDAQTASLPYASSLCGACFDACPVRIDIPEVLVHLRGKVVEHGGVPNEERVMMGSLGWAFGGPRRLRRAERLAGLGGRVVGRGGRIGRLRLPGMLGRWFRWRDMPAPARQSFRAWWRKSRVVGGRTVSVDARTEILDRIRAAFPAPPAVAVPRDYRRTTPAGRRHRRAVRRARRRLSGDRPPRRPREDLAEVVATALAARGARRLVVPAGIPDDWLAARRTSSDSPTTHRSRRPTSTPPTASSPAVRSPSPRPARSSSTRAPGRADGR